MAEINIANSIGRDAVVTMDHIGAIKKVRWLDRQGRQANSIRVLKAPIERDGDALAQQLGGSENLGQALLDGDPEVDLEVTGTFLRQASRVYIDRQHKIVHKVTPWEIIRTPDGQIKERRQRVRLPPNVATEFPLRWSGTFIKKVDAYRRFVFVTKLQLIHINGLTYDFLFNMAKELHERDALMLLGAGAKSNQPLILRRGAAPYRGFLEGRIQDDKYCLILHLSNLELKAPPPTSENCETPTEN